MEGPGKLSIDPITKINIFIFYDSKEQKRKVW